MSWDPTSLSGAMRIIASSRFFALLLSVAAAGMGADAEVLRSGWVPNSWMPQGQIQLVANENKTLSVNVLLHTRYLDRVVNNIIAKETANWPKNHPDAVRYIRHLRETRQFIHGRTGGRGRENMIIVFDLSPGGEVRWGTGTIREEQQSKRLVLPAPEWLHRFQPSRDYLVLNAVLILEDSLGLNRQQVLELFAGRLDETDLRFLKASPDEG